jgi:uncharacterized phage protein gp47/JayE
MAFPTRTFVDTHEFLIAHYKALNPDDDVSVMSHNWLWLATLAAGVTDNHAHIKSNKSDLFPGTALGDMLVAWSNLRGVKRKGATGARKSAAYRVFGTVLTGVPKDAELVHVSGLLFKIGATTVVGPNGYVDCDISAKDVGSATRLSKGERLTLTTGIAGLEDEGELQLDMDEDGTDIESEGSLSARMVNRWSNSARRRPRE